METHSSILAQKIPRTEEPASLQSMGLQRARHDRACMQIVSTTEEELVLSPPVAPSMQKHSPHHPVLFFSFIYFISGCAGSLLLHMGLLQLRRAGDYCLVAACRLLVAVASLVVELGLQGAGSVVMAHGISCPMASGIFLGQGLNSCSPHWQVDSQPLDHEGRPPRSLDSCVILIER